MKHVLLLAWILLFLGSFYQFGIIYTFIFASLYLLYLCEMFKTLDVTLRNFYARYKGVRTLVSHGRTHKFLFIKAIILLSRTIWQTAWHSFLCYINNTVTKHGNDTLITVAHKGKLYKMLVSNIGRPDNVLEVIDQDSNDVTNDVIPYLRFMNLPLKRLLTPKILGYKELEIITTDKIIEIKENDNIYTN